MTPKEAATALDLLEKSRSMWTKEDEPVDTEDIEIPEEFSDCNTYHIDVMCWFGNQPYQFRIVTLLNDAEAMAACNKLADVMFNIVKTGISSFSIKLRSQTGSIVSRVFTNVVYMEHDIPTFKEVAEDENVEE